jgi:hypothetical protein
MFTYTSTLSADYREDLEELLFFNPGQSSMVPAIMTSIEKYGQPQLRVENNKLLVRVEKLPDVQSLYALDEHKLVGALIYCRSSIKHLELIHLAVAQDYSSHGHFANKLLLIRLINLLRTNSRRIKGVQSIGMILEDSRVQYIPIK